MMIVSYLVALVTTIGLLSYFLDFGGQLSELRFILFFVCVFVCILFVRRWVRVINDYDTRSFVYTIFGIGVLLPSLILSEITHELRHPMAEFATMHDAIQSGEEYIHVKNVGIDTSRHGVFMTYRVIPRRHQHSEIEHVVFVTFQIKNVKNAFWGYTLNSCCMSPKDNEKRAAFFASLDEMIKTHAIPHGEGYYRRIMSKTEDYDAFMNACRNINIPIESPVFFTNLMSSTKDNIIRELKWMFITMFASLFIILLVFLFAKKDRSQSSINKEIKRERSQAIAYISNRDNWSHILLFILFVGYFLMMLAGGYNDVYGGIHLGQMQQWGAISKYLCIDRCEFWRLISYSFVHVSIWHLAVNLVLFALFVYFYSGLLRSWLLWIVFICTSIAVGLMFILLYPHEMLLGASGGIMGLYGYRIGKGIDTLIDDIKKRPKKKKKTKTNIVAMLFVLMGTAGACIILPTIIIVLIIGINLTVYITGLLGGIFMWYIIKRICPSECLKQGQRLF